MKKVIIALFALVVSFSVAVAQQVPDEEKGQTPSSTQADDKVKVRVEELPDAVKKALQSEEFTGWTISNAYYRPRTSVYEIELKNKAEIKTVKLSKEGKKIE